MKRAYLQLWALAKPYYLRGRPMDVDHIMWMMDVAETVCTKEKLDDSILLPVVILHDIGYADVPKKNPFTLDIRRTHMVVGAKIARRLLHQVNYSQEKTERIVKYVAVHDAWAFGENELYNNDKILGTFNDLDYLWTVTPKGFDAVARILNKDHRGMISWIEHEDKPIKRPWSTKTTQNIYTRYLAARKKLRT